jgi:hypothetical protein
MKHIWILCIILSTIASVKKSSGYPWEIDFKKIQISFYSKLNSIPTGFSIIVTLSPLPPL